MFERHPLVKYDEYEQHLFTRSSELTLVKFSQFHRRQTDKKTMLPRSLAGKQRRQTDAKRERQNETCRDGWTVPQSGTSERHAAIGTSPK